MLSKRNRQWKCVVNKETFMNTTESNFEKLKRITKLVNILIQFNEEVLAENQNLQNQLNKFEKHIFLLQEEKQTLQKTAEENLKLRTSNVENEFKDLKLLKAQLEGFLNTVNKRITSIHHQN